MVRPCRFAYNEQTAVNNAFQLKSDQQAEGVQQQAVREFDAFVQLLRDNGVTVDVLQDTPEPSTPDSIFPKRTHDVCPLHHHNLIRIHVLFGNILLKSMNSLFIHIFKQILTVHDRFHDQGRVCHD